MSARRRAANPGISRTLVTGERDVLHATRRPIAHRHARSRGKRGAYSSRSRDSTNVSSDSHWATASAYGGLGRATD